MTEGFWLYDHLKDNADYYEAVPLYIEVKDPDSGRAWAGPVTEVKGTVVDFIDEDGDEAMTIRFIPSKNANRLLTMTGEFITAKCRVNLQPLSEVDHV